MDAIATAIVGYIFVCIVFPHLVKTRAQYYGAVAAILLAMVLNSIAVMAGAGGFSRFAIAFTILLEAVAVVLLILATGGMSIRELGADMARAYEVMRRGETEKTVIIPLGEQKPMPKTQEGTDGEAKPYVINEPPAAPPAKSGGDEPVPLE